MLIAHLDPQEEDPFTAGEENALEHSESFLLRPGDHEKILSCLSEGPAQRVSRKVEKHCSVRKSVVLPARATVRSPPLSTPADSCQLQKRASIQPALLDLGLALRTSLHKGRRASPGREL